MSPVFMVVFPIQESENKWKIMRFVGGGTGEAGSLKSKKLGPKLKTLIILYLSFEIEVSDIKCKLRPLNMHPKVLSFTLAAAIGNYWQSNFWS